MSDRVAVMYLGSFVWKEAYPKRCFTHHAPLHGKRLYFGGTTHAATAVRDRMCLRLADPPNSGFALPSGARFNPRLPVAIARCKPMLPKLAIDAAGQLPAIWRLRPAASLSPARAPEIKTTLRCFKMTLLRNRLMLFYMLSGRTGIGHVWLIINSLLSCCGFTADPAELFWVPMIGASFIKPFSHSWGLRLSPIHISIHALLRSRLSR